MLQFQRGLSCVLLLLCASFAVRTPSLWHWMFMAMCGFGARLSQIVLSVATAAGSSSFLRSVCVGFYVVAVSCGLWSAHFIPIWSSRALSVYILSTSVFSCRLEGLSMSVPYCSRLSITLAYFSSPFGITTKSTTCTQTSCLMSLFSFRHLTTFSTMFLDELMVSKRVVHHQQSLHAKAYPSAQSIWLETFLGSTLWSGTDLWLPRRPVQLMQLLALSVRTKAQKTLPTGCKFCLRTVLWLPLRRQSPSMLDPSLAPNGSARKLKTPTTTAWQKSWTTRFRACILRKGLLAQDGLVSSVDRGRCGKVALFAAAAVALMAIQRFALLTSYRVPTGTRPPLPKMLWSRSASCDAWHGAPETLTKHSFPRARARAKMPKGMTDYGMESCWEALLILWAHCSKQLRRFSPKCILPKRVSLLQDQCFFIAVAERNGTAAYILGCDALLLASLLARLAAIGRGRQGNQPMETRGTPQKRV